MYEEEIIGKRAVIYARVSSKEQEQEGYSIPAQLELLQSYARKKGLIVIHEFVEAESAKKAGRSGFNSMVKFFKEEEKTNREERCRIIIVEKTDRLQRNLRDWVTIDELDVEIHLVKENEIISDESSSHAKFIHGIKVLMARNYSDNLSEETKKGMLQKAKQGIFPSNAPLGYKNVDLNGRRVIEPDPEYAPLIKKLFRWYATGNYSLKEVNSLLYEEGLVSRKAGNKLSKSNIHKILSNPIYYGDFEWDGVHYEGIHEPIVTRDTWYQVKNVRSEKARKRTGKQKYDWAFRGMVSCGHCGCALTAEKKKSKYVYYHCTGHKGKCPEKYVREEDLAEQFGEALAAIEIDEEVLNWVVAALRESHKEEKDYHNEMISKLQRSYQKLQDKLDKSYEEKLEGKIPEETYERLSKKWRREQEDTRRQIERHENANRSYFENGVKILELAQKAGKLYKKQEMSEKRQLLNFVFSNSTWKHGRLVPNYRKPFDLLAVTNTAYHHQEANLTAKDGLLKEWRPEKDSNLRPTA